jgi:hypothetical protein
MGLNKDEGRRIYLSITDGKITRQHQNPVEGVTTSRVNKKGVTVHEEFFKSFAGKLKSIKSKEAPFGMVWECVMEDPEDGQEYQISWQYSSRYTNNFFRALPNVALDREFKFAPWSMKDKQDKTKTIVGLSLYQEGASKDGKVPFAWTKEEPGDMPPMTQRKKAGKLVWEDSDQLDFFETVAQTINSKLASGASTVADEVKENKPDGWPFVEEDDDDKEEKAF